MHPAETIPRERQATVRQELMRLLADRQLSANALSREIHLSEKEINSHLEELRRTGILILTPARCRGCGYVFAQRARTRKPGRCPSCRGSHIEPPLFSITARQ